MRKFVQRSDRNIELPLGCKDLFDAQEIRDWRPRSERKAPKMVEDKLAYFEGYLVSLLEPCAGSVLVGVSLFQGTGHVHVMPDTVLPTPVIFVSWNGAAQQNALQSAIENAGLQPLTEPIGRWKSDRALKHLLPGNPSLAASVIGQIFRNGYGLAWVIWSQSLCGTMTQHDKATALSVVASGLFQFRAAGASRHSRTNWGRG